MTTGWYCKVVFPGEQAQTRWLVVSDNFIHLFQNSNDKSPIHIFHVDGIQLSNGFGQIDQLHSLMVDIGHISSLQKFFVYTPNQFDIMAIQKAILAEQKKWNNSVSTTSPDLSQTFTVDIIGKFVYRPADRISLRVEPGKIVLTGKENRTIVIDKKFDCYTTNDQKRDQKWITMKFFENQDYLFNFHCDNVQKMIPLLNILMHCKYAYGK